MTVVTATAVDNLGYASSGSFQVHVFDDVPPIDITLSGSSVAETDAAGFAVGEFSTVDPETNNTFVYTLVDGVTYPGNAAFAVEGNQLRTRQWFDYESESAYQICVRSTDPVGLYAERTFTILVTTVPDVLVLTPPGLDGCRIDVGRQRRDASRLRVRHDGRCGAAARRRRPSGGPGGRPR